MGLISRVSSRTYRCCGFLGMSHYCDSDEEGEDSTKISLKTSNTVINLKQQEAACMESISQPRQSSPRPTNISSINKNSHNNETTTSQQEQISNTTTTSFTDSRQTTSSSPLLQNTNISDDTSPELKSPSKNNSPNLNNPTFFSFILQNFESFNPPETYQKFIATIRYLLDSYKQTEKLKQIIYSKLRIIESQNLSPTILSQNILKQVINTLQSDLELAILLAQNLLQELLQRIDFNNGKLRDQLNKNYSKNDEEHQNSSNFNNIAINSDHESDYFTANSNTVNFDQASISTIQHDLETSNQDSALGTTMGTGKTSLTRNPSIASI